MLTDDGLRGRSVLSKDGIKIGHVTRVVIDPGTFRIATLEVHVYRSVADRIGLAHGFLQGPSLQIPTEQVQSMGDAVILSIDVGALARLDTKKPDKRSEVTASPS